MLVTNRQSSPRRIMAVSNNGEISLWAHHASVTPMASKAVPATTGYRGISLSLGAGRMRLHATTEVGRASSVSSLRLRTCPVASLGALSFGMRGGELQIPHFVRDDNIKN